MLKVDVQPDTWLRWPHVYIQQIRRASLIHLCNVIKVRTILSQSAAKKLVHYYQDVQNMT